MDQPLVLCERGDRSALRVYHWLRASGLTSLDLVTGEMLCHALAWEHRIGASPPTGRVRLADGRTLRTEGPGAVLNRLSAVQERSLARIRAEDRAYARDEMQALMASWLLCVEGLMLNRPTPDGLGGRWRHRGEWAMRAAAAGLLASEVTDGSAEAARPYEDPMAAAQLRVFVIDDRVVGAPDDALAESALRLARGAGVGVIGLAFEHTDDGPSLLDVSLAPDLLLGGDAALHALRDALVRRGAA